MSKSMVYRDYLRIFDRGIGIEVLLEQARETATPILTDEDLKKKFEESFQMSLSQRDINNYYYKKDEYYYIIQDEQSELRAKLEYYS